MKKELATFAPVVVLGLGAVFSIACRAEDPSPARTDNPEIAMETADTRPAPSLEELADATFIGIADQAVQLTDGGWEGEPWVEGGAARPAVGLVDGFLLTGDLDRDGSEEAVVLLWTSSGGSGTFDYLAVAERQGDEVVNLGTAEIGDRVKVRAARVVEGRVELDVVQAGPDDAACCPTQMATRTWALDSDGLTELEAEVTGTLSLGVLDGTHWVLTNVAWEEPAPTEPSVTLAFETDRIAGSAGCNGYFASIEASGDGATAVSLGPLGTTRKMCPEPIMAVEDRFLRQLGGLSSFSFSAGKLLLDWADGETSGTMLFEPGAE